MVTVHPAAQTRRRAQRRAIECWTRPLFSKREKNSDTDPQAMVMTVMTGMLNALVRQRW
jgi:hypothetical protein